MDVRHDVIQQAIELSRVVQGEDVRVLEAGNCPNLPQEPLGADGGRQLWSQDLDGNQAVVLVVVREVDGRHATPTDLALDAESVAEESGQGSVVVDVGHVAPREGLSRGNMNSPSADRNAQPGLPAP